MAGSTGIDLATLGHTHVLRGDGADVDRHRELGRRRRLTRIALVLAPVTLWLYVRLFSGNPVQFGFPHVSPTVAELLPGMFLVVLLGAVVLVPMAVAGRSPHIQFAPSELHVGFDDVVGLGPVKDEVVRSLNLFLAYKTFQERMGGNPRKGMLFEGPPGTGKTYMAKAMAREAGVPFLFVSSSAFQSMYFGQTNRKIRSFFRELREAARREGGAIGFIEEIDAIAGARSGMRSRATAMSDGSDGSDGGRAIYDNLGSEGISGIVNELLIQLQSFDTPTGGERFRNGWISFANRWLPVGHQIAKPAPVVSNVLVIGATNRASDLDPALLRPGRFDRSIHFGLPSKAGRRELIDYYLSRKAHTPELDKEEKRDQLAAMTFGYSPAMVEHLLDESLVWALREAREAMSWLDVQQAKLTEEIGLQQPVEYTVAESETIATHESGHAVVAYLMGPSRKLEMLSIVKRRDALGLLAHSDTEERFTRTRSELVSSIHIAFGGMVAEELFFGETGTGPAGDLASATQTAARMVGQFGMAGSLISFDAVESGPITQGIVGKVLADEEARHSVERILLQAQREVRDLLDAKRHLVVALRDALLEHEELVGDEILAVLRTAELRHELEPPSPPPGGDDGTAGDARPGGA